MQATVQKTTCAKKGDVEKTWHQFSADNEILGRFAAKIAMILMGKTRVDYTRHVDTGDFVIVTNADKIRVTGKKAETKQYDHYTYHPGGHKYENFSDLLQKKPEKIITEAVRRMLPKSKLGRKMLSKLKVYRAGEHPHTAQLTAQTKPINS